MKNNSTKIFLALLAAFFTGFSAFAQSGTNGISVVAQKSIKENDRLSVNFDIVLDDAQISRNDMLTFIPVLRSNTSADSLELDPAVVMGSTRAKVVERQQKLGEPSAMPSKVFSSLIRKNNTKQRLNYIASVPYAQWMQDASLAVRNRVSGCANCGYMAQELGITPRVLPNLAYDPSYKLTYIVPEVEPVKTRSDRHTATFNFVVDRYELQRNYKNNAAELAQVDKVIREIQSNTDFRITEFAITGYASPEGGFEHNRTLAKNRANSFAEYLVSKFGVARNRFTVEGLGEDWDGLRAAVEKSALGDKQAVLNIIDNVSNPDARDAELKKLSNGETYRTLVRDLYPPLRRTEYVVAYVVRAFDVQEAKQIIKTNPKILSLNEMYLVAETYPTNSKEFKEVFDIAARMYPDSEIAILNSAASEIESGDNDAAIRRMEKMASNPKMWNNLGLAYARKGDLAKAQEYFSKAASNGDADALHNALELKKHLEGLK